MSNKGENDIVDRGKNIERDAKELLEQIELLSILAGIKLPTEKEMTELLRVAVKCGVAVLYEHYKKDVIEKFSVEELQDIVETTEAFSCFSVEHIFHTALYGPSQKHCDWGHEDDYGIHETSCGHAFEFTTDGVEETE